MDWQLNPATHLVVVGDSDRSDVPRPCIGAALAGFVPRRVVQNARSRRSGGAGRSPQALSGMLAAGRPAGLRLRRRELQPARGRPAVLDRETLESLRPSVPA